MTAPRFPGFTSPQFKADPYPVFARLRAEAPVHRIRWLLGKPVWIVSRYDDVVTVLKDDRFSKVYVKSIPLVPSSLEKLTRNMVNADPPDHTRLRALVSKAFTPRMVEGLRGRVQALCDELLDSAVRRGDMELIRDFALPIPLTIIADLLGIPQAERRTFATWSKQVAGGDTGRVLDALRGFGGMWKFGRYFRKLVALRRANPRSDLVTALVQAEEAGDRLDEEELIAMIGLLLFAGYETTVNLIATGALALMENEEQRELFRANPALAGSAVEELLRFSSPAAFSTPRVAREAVSLSGSVIPKGAMVLAALASANRDESHFRDPEVLDLARTPNRHLALGTGIHFCLGAPLARLEGQVALTALFARLPRLRPAVDRGSLRWRRGLLVRGLEALPVAWS